MALKLNRVTLRFLYYLAQNVIVFSLKVENLHVCYRNFLFATKWNALSRQACEVSVKPDLTSDALQWFAICIFVHANVLVTKNRIRRLVMRTDGYTRTCLVEIREFDIDFTRKITLKLGLFNLELLICHSKHWGIMKLLCFASVTLPKLTLIYSNLNRCYHFLLLKKCQQRHCHFMTGSRSSIAANAVRSQIRSKISNLKRPSHFIYDFVIKCGCTKQIFFPRKPVNKDICSERCEVIVT